MKKFAWCVAACVAVALCTSARGALTPGQKMAVEALIKQFSAPEFDARQKAVDRLVEMGTDVVPVVKDAMAKTLDAEVKLRCEMVLKALKADEPATPKDKFGYGPSKITLDVKDMPLAEVVEKLAAQSGNRPINVPGDLRERTVTLSVKDADYWVAVQALCEKLGLVVMNDWRRMTAGGEDVGWFQLLEAEKDAKLAGFSGPVVVRPDLCTKTMIYSELKNSPMNPMSGGRQSSAVFALGYAYEDRLTPIASGLELKALLGSDGKDYTPAQGPERGLPSAYMWPGNPKAPPWGTAQILLPPLPGDLRKFAEVSGVVRLEFGSGEREVRIDDVMNAIGKEMKFDDWTVTVVKAGKGNGIAQVQIEAAYKGQSTPISAWMTGGSYGWYLKEAEGGRKVRGYGTGGGGRWAMMTGGGLKGVVRGNPGQNEPPKPGAQTLMFQGEFEGAWSLVLLLPTAHETKEYPFTIKDVPLP